MPLVLRTQLAQPASADISFLGVPVRHVLLTVPIVQILTYAPFVTLITHLQPVIHVQCVHCHAKPAMAQQGPVQNV